MLRLSKNDLGFIAGGDLYTFQDYDGKTTYEVQGKPSRYGFLEDSYYRYILPDNLAHELLNGTYDYNYYVGISEEKSMEKYGVDAYTRNEMVVAFYYEG